MGKKYEMFKLPENYKLAWQADFTKPLDTDLWLISDGPRKGGYWSPEQVILKDGKLIIRTEYKEKDGKPGYYTGDLHWKNKRSKYGYYEIRCKIDNVRGCWSAFWLMPDIVDIDNKAQKAQDGCEIDIFENAKPYRLQTTLHWDAYTGQKMKSRRVKELYDGFHTFAVDWKKDGLKFYYDNKMIWHITNPNHISHCPTTLEMSTEINGFTKNGVPKPNRTFWLGNGIITNKKNKLPYDYIIDYVKVYDNGQLEWSESDNVINF